MKHATAMLALMLTLVFGAAPFVQASDKPAPAAPAAVLTRHSTTPQHPSRRCNPQHDEDQRPVGHHTLAAENDIPTGPTQAHRRKSE